MSNQNRFYAGIDLGSKIRNWQSGRVSTQRGATVLLNPAAGDSILYNPPNPNWIVCLDYYRVTINGNAHLAAAGNQLIAFTWAGWFTQQIGEPYMLAAAPGTAGNQFDTGFCNLYPNSWNSDVSEMVQGAFALNLLFAVVGTVFVQYGYHLEES